MGKVEVTEQNGTKIVKIDFSGLRNTQDIQSVIQESMPYIRSSEAKTICTLTNIKGMHFNNEIKELFSKFTKENKDYVKAAAIYGASGLQKIVINGIIRFTGRRLKAFDDLTSAKVWLTTQN